jgi:hypothetical protein
MQFRKPNYRRLGSSSHRQCGFRHSGFKRIAEASQAGAAVVVDPLRQYPDARDHLSCLTLKIAAQTARALLNSNAESRYCSFISNALLNNFN